MASLPPVNISTKSFKIFGPTYQRPFGAEYGGEGISFTFHVDRDMKVKTFFDDWMLSEQILAVSANESADLAIKPTEYPFFTASMASALPMPEEAPVMRATRQFILGFPFDGTTHGRNFWIVDLQSVQSKFYRIFEINTHDRRLIFP